MKVTVVTAQVRLEAELLNNQPARELIKKLPVEGNANRWGDELYFECPLDTGTVDLKQVMKVGEIGYWIEGGALAIFFGPTPFSSDERPKAVVPVAVIGRIKTDATLLRQVQSGDNIRLEAADTPR